MNVAPLLCKARPTLFERATARRLRLTRLAFGVLIGLRIAVGPYPALADQPAALWRPVSFLRWLGVDAMPGAEFIVAVQLVGGLAAALAVAGSFRWTRWTTPATTRAAFAVGWLALLVLAGLRTSTGKLLHNDVLLLIATIPLLFAEAPTPEDDARQGRRFGWPLSVGLAAVCIAYFAAGVAKLRHSGLAWVTGDNMRYVMLVAARSGRPEFPEIARTIGRSAILSYLVAAGILALELAFPAAYLVRRVRPFFAAAAVAFSIGIWLTLGLDYWLWAATAAVLLAPPVRLAVLTGYEGGVSEPEPVDGALASVLSSCTVRRLWAEQDEGPYRREAQPTRRDIVEDREGAPLQLGIRLRYDGDGGERPVEGTVEIWQCDALGRYSGFPPPDSSVVVTAATAPRSEYLADQTFLRGRQTTDGQGMVEFRTIFPGWYPGRTVHIHLMVHADDRVLTSQLYFPDDMADRVLATAPYSERPNRDTTNTNDEIFPTGGDPAVLDVSAAEDGYRAAICLVIPTAGASS